MAKKSMHVVEITLRCALVDLPLAYRKECAELAGLKLRDIGRASDVEPEEFADIVACCITDNEELWAGTDQYARVGHASVISAKRVTP